MIEPIYYQYNRSDIAKNGFYMMECHSGTTNLYFKANDAIEFIIETYDCENTNYWLQDLSRANAGGFYAGKVGFKPTKKEAFVNYLHSSNHPTLDWFLFNLDIFK